MSKRTERVENRLAYLREIVQREGALDVDGTLHWAAQEISDITARESARAAVRDALDDYFNDHFVVILGTRGVLFVIVVIVALVIFAQLR